MLLLTGFHMLCVYRYSYQCVCARVSVCRAVTTSSVAVDVAASHSDFTVGMSLLSNS